MCEPVSFIMGVVKDSVTECSVKGIISDQFVAIDENKQHEGGRRRANAGQCSVDVASHKLCHIAEHLSGSH